MNSILIILLAMLPSWLTSVIHNTSVSLSAFIVGSKAWRFSCQLYNRLLIALETLGTTLAIALSIPTICRQLRNMVQNLHKQEAYQLLTAQLRNLARKLHMQDPCQLFSPLKQFGVTSEAWVTLLPCLVNNFQKTRSKNLPTAPQTIKNHVIQQSMTCDLAAAHKHSTDSNHTFLPLIKNYKSFLTAQISPSVGDL